MVVVVAAKELLRGTRRNGAVRLTHSMEVATIAPVVTTNLISFLLQIIIHEMFF